MFMATVKHALPAKSIPLNIFSAKILFLLIWLRVLDFWCLVCFTTHIGSTHGVPETEPSAAITHGKYLTPSGQGR
jgi:hypothetical protein